MNDAFDLAACGLLVTGAHGEISRVNRTMCSWLGYESDELCGRKFQDLLTIGSKLFHYTQWMPLLQIQGSIAEVQLQLVAKSGKVLPALVNAVTRPGDHRAVDIAVMIVVDRREYEQQLVEARAQAEELLTREREARDATAAATRRLESFVMDAPTAMAVLSGPALSFELANNRFRTLMHAQVVIGAPLRACLDLAEDSRLWKMLLAAYETGTTSAEMDYRSELPFHSTDEGRGPGVHLDLVVLPTIGADGEREGVFIHMNDVSERAQARIRLEESNRELERFAYVVSHDLKAPLRAINNLAAWINEDEGERLSEGGRTNLKLMEERVAHMHALIDGVLRVARAGATEDGVVRVDVRELLLQIFGMLDVPSTVRIEIGEQMPTLETAPIALEQVLRNLVSNALKHASGEHAVVKIDATDDGNRILFSVADNGPGIAPEHHERIWKMFQTLNRTRSSDSTGIGLAIVRKVVELRGGRAWVESEVGKGATFYFTWPKEQPRP